MRDLITLSLCWPLTGNANAQSPQSAMLHGPLITFMKLAHDYGTIDQGADGNCFFTCINTGDQPLIISNCQSSCGCVVCSCDPEPVAPGKSALVRVRYDTNRVGPFVRSVTLTSNSVVQPALVLRMKGQVRPRSEEPTPAVPALSR